MFERELAKQLLEATKYYPIIILTGPRQSGKTTLVRHVFKKHQYFNLEDPDVLEQIKLDPRKFLRENKKPLIIDEVQNYYHIFKYSLMKTHKKVNMF